MIKDNYNHNKTEQHETTRKQRERERHSDRKTYAGREKRRQDKGEVLDKHKDEAKDKKEETNKIRKSGALELVLNKYEFRWTFDAKTQGPDLVKNEFGR